MFARRLAAPAALLTALFLTATAAPADAAAFGKPTSEYAATMVYTSEGQTQRMKHHYAGNLQRFDMTTPQGKASMIVNLTKRQTIMLIAAQNMALIVDGQTKIADAMPYETLNDEGADVKVTKEGTEEVDGVATTRYRVIHTKNGEKRFDGLMWVTAENIIARYKGKSTKDGATVDSEMKLEGLTLGKQDAKLFKIPAGVRAIKADPRMMKGMKGLPGQ